MASLHRDEVMTFVMAKFGEPMVMYDRFQFALRNKPERYREWTFKGPDTSHLYPPINMANVKVTTLVVQADDDPIVHGWQVNWGRLLQNKNIICLHTKRGGHVAHFDQAFPFGDTYMDSGDDQVCQRGARKPRSHAVPRDGRAQ